MKNIWTISERCSEVIWGKIPNFLSPVPGLHKALRDGWFISGVPAMNVILPLLAIMIGFMTGVMERGGMPVYTAHPVMLAMMLLMGVLSGYLGILAFIGFLFGDLIFFSFYNYYHPSVFYPLAILASWIFLWQLVIGFPDLMRKITQLPAKFKKAEILLCLPLTMAMTEIWTQLAMIVLRPMFLWNAREVNMKLVNFGSYEWEFIGLQAHMLTWIAGGSVLLRFISKRIFGSFFQPIQMSDHVRTSPIIFNIPWPYPQFFNAALFSLLMAGLFTKFWSAVFFWLSIGGLAAIRSFASCSTAVMKWDGWMDKIPPLVRLLLSYMLAFGLSYYLIGFFRDMMGWRTLTVAAVTVIFAIGVTLPLWPLGPSPSLQQRPKWPQWIKRFLPWLKDGTLSACFLLVALSAGTALAHHCSFRPGCECLTGRGALASVISALSVLGLMSLNVVRGLAALTPEQRASFAADMAPGLGDIKGLQEAALGRDLVTGEEVTGWVRVLGAIPVFGRLAKASKIAKVLSKARILGKEGEAFVRARYKIGLKEQIKINGRMRIPDGISRNTLSEVKNVKKLSYTRQLRDYAQYAKQKGLKFDLYVRKDTQISGPLKKASDEGLINIIRVIE